MTPSRWLRQASPLLRATFAGLLTIGLSSCGGGGSGSPDTSATASQSTVTSLSATTSSVPGYLILSEVATNYYSNDIAWLEVHNPGTTSVALSRYALRTGAINPDTAVMASAPMTFALPALEVPPGGHVVIAARTADKFIDNSQMVYVRNGSNVPFWRADGAAELLIDGVTADFVRFGNAAVTPATGTAWSGSNVAAMPSAGDEHGKSIVRLAAAGMRDTNSAADWTLVNFATPAGSNDVAPGVVDSDADGIPDSAKVSGGTYAGLDLYAMGARRGRRDIFVEIDHMPGSDPGTTPRLEALQKIESAFAAKGIALHVDAGALYSAGFDPARFNLGGGNPVPFAPCIDLDSVGSGATRSGCSSFMATKSAHFDVRRKLLFHYAVFGNSLKVDGSAGSSGIAELNGNDLIIALGGYSFSTEPGSGLNMLVNLQASTLMHELGHNLGLRHGGDENANYKPNHYSVMNYMYQFAGLSATPSSVHAAERYYLANGLKSKTLCGLVENSPCGDQFVLSYSDGSGADLDENTLTEGVNIGRGAVPGAYADWDNNGSFSGGTFAWNINPRDDSFPTLKSVLRDYNEWANLSLPFSRNYSGSNSGNTLTDATRTARSEQPKERKRERIVEEPLPEHLHSTLREMARHRHGH